ncbi:hypothetical protein [Empedobacter falsenii]
MSKEEKIKEAWGEYWNKLPNEVQEKALKNNGFVSQYFEDLLTIDKRERKLFEIRPKSLQGIETNNGWVKVESEDDLPKEEGFYLVFNKIHKAIEVDYINYDNESHEERWIEFNSHYQPIEKPKQPIY